MAAAVSSAFSSASDRVRSWLWGRPPMDASLRRSLIANGDADDNNNNNDYRNVDDNAMSPVHSSLTASQVQRDREFVRHYAPAPDGFSCAGQARVWGHLRPEKRLGEPIVVIDQLTKSYHLALRDETVRALKCIDLRPDGDIYSVLRGEFVMIRGPSGGGKTTLLNILGTIDEPTSGAVSILGHRIDAQSTDSFLANLRLCKIGFVFQTFNLLATMSAFENVELPMTMLGKLSSKECKKRALELLDMVGLQDRYSHLPSELSGGEQQRVTIARALSNDPELLLLDEPTGDLDTRNTVDVMDLLLRINQERGTTCIMVTHNPDLECYADRVLYVEDGRFKKQAINRRQSRLHYATYMRYINQFHSHQ